MDFAPMISEEDVIDVEDLLHPDHRIKIRIEH